MNARIRGAAQALARVWRDSRLRSEVAWVVATQVTDFVLMFVLLKLLTNGIGKREFGEYNLADTASVALAALLLSPVQEPFLRQYYAFREAGTLRSAGRLLLRWYVGVTIAVVALAAPLSAAAGRGLDLGAATLFAGALAFASERWRTLGHDFRNQRRERKPWAIWHLGFRLSLLASLGLAVLLGASRASTILGIQAAVAAVFSLPNLRILVREVRGAPAGKPAGLETLVRTFGIPFASLLVFQWFQNFSDRYVVKAMLDAEAVGIYVAAYQVCGIPFTFLTFAVNNLLTPVAYQRAGSGSDPARLWAADRLLLGGLAVLVALGIPMLAFYAWLGADLVALLTNDSFRVSRTVIVLLALARFFQAAGLVVQPIFSVHQRISRMLGFRVVGALLGMGICILTTRSAGLAGAALGSALAFATYLLGLALLPGGLVSTVSGARARSRADR